MKLSRALLASMIFLIVLVAVYYIHINYFRVDVVFYAAIADGILAAIFTAALLWTLQVFDLLTGFEKSLLFVIWLMTSYAVAISVPTVIDRSLSLYILEKLQQRGGGIRRDSFAQVFTEEYMVEHRLVDVRLTEQMQSGTIRIDDQGCVLLTNKGQRIASFGRYFRTNWLPRERLLMGEYTDDLTDPFRESSAEAGYTCGPGNANTGESE